MSAARSRVQVIISFRVTPVLSCPYERDAVDEQSSGANDCFCACLLCVRNAVLRWPVAPKGLGTIRRVCFFLHDYPPSVIVNVCRRLPWETGRLSYLFPPASGWHRQRSRLIVYCSAYKGTTIYGHWRTFRATEATHLEKILACLLHWPCSGGGGVFITICRTAYERSPINQFPTLCKKWLQLPWYLAFHVWNAMQNLTM